MISSSLITFFAMGAKPPKRTQNSPESDSVSNFPSSAMWDSFFQVTNKELTSENRYQNHIIGNSALTNNCNITFPFMIFFFQKLYNFQSLGSFLNVGICTIELINLTIGVKNEHIIMVQWRPCKRDLPENNFKLHVNRIKEVHEQTTHYLFQSDNSFPSAYIQTCFKLLLFRFSKSRCNTPL